MKFTALPYYLIIFLLVFASTSSCSSKRKKQISAQQGISQRPPARVDGFIVHTESISESIEVPGTIVASEATEIHPEISGRITALNIREGAVVGRGTLLAKIYDGDLQAQKRKLEVQLGIAKATEERYEQLLKIGGISRQDYDLTVLQVRNLQADLDIIRTSIARTEIRAPFTGKTGFRGVSTGAFVTPQSVITTIQKTSGLRVDFSVPEKYAGQIRNGHYVNFRVDGSNRAYTAVVVASESGIQQNTRTLTLRAQVRGDEGGLVPGGFARVRIHLDPDEDAIMIPTQAVISQARGKKVYVYRDGTAKFMDITTGMRDSSRVQILQGLERGDTIITTGLLGLKPEARVIIRQIINKPPGGGS